MGKVRILVLLVLIAFISPVAPASATTVTVSGAVTSAKGPVTRGTVYFFANCQDYTAGVSSGMATVTDGRYSTAIPTGTYLVRIEPKGNYHAAKSWHSAAMSCEAATPVTVGVDATVDLLAAATVLLSGTVSTADGTVTSGQVWLFADCASSAMAAQDTNLADGFTVEVAPGTYRAQIRIAGAVSWHSATNTCQQAAPIVATADTSVDLIAVPTRTITGTVATGNGPVTTAIVTMYADCSQVTENIWMAPVLAQMTNGTFTATLAAGTYLARIDPAAGQGALMSWHAGKSGCADATPITITGNDNVSLIATPENNVSGTVRTKKGPVRKGYLAFFSSCQALEHSSQPQAAILFEGGTYRGTVPDGTYLVRIGNFAATDSWHSGALSCQAATPVAVSGMTVLNFIGLGGEQTVKRPPKVVKRGTKVTLARTTDRGVKVSWESLTPGKCTIKKRSLVGSSRGVCRVKATAPAGLVGLKPLAATFKVRVR